ncbi:MAG: hypothetical protein AAFR46_18840 [Pseudomonadota bacterium]
MTFSESRIGSDLAPPGAALCALSPDLCAPLPWPGVGWRRPAGGRCALLRMPGFLRRGLTHGSFGTLVDCAILAAFLAIVILLVGRLA